MLVVVSPAKKLDMSPNTQFETSCPMFPNHAQKLAQTASELGQSGLMKLMKISENLAKLNKSRFDSFGHQEKKPALFAFAGDTYQGIDASTLDNDAIRWAQDHLRILSGLYGVLRPLDEMEPYRLEMGSKLKVDDKKSLYEYWGDQIALYLNELGEKTGSSLLVNCASQEYFGAVDKNALKLRVITPQFYELTEKGPKIVSFYAKRARGAMARFIVENRIDSDIGLNDFNIGGYKYDAAKSSTDAPVFLRG